MEIVRTGKITEKIGMKENKKLIFVWYMFLQGEPAKDLTHCGLATPLGDKEPMLTYHQ